MGDNRYSDADLKRSGVYQISNTIDDKVYIGSTALGFRKRWWQHRNDFKNGKSHNPHLQNIWNLYGKEFLVFDIVEFVDNPDDLMFQEQKRIDDAFSKGICINTNRYADSPLGFKLSQDAIAKKSLGMKRAWADKSRRESWVKSLAGNGHRLQQILNGNQEIKKKREDGFLLALQDPEVIKKKSESALAFYSTPEGKEIRDMVSDASRTYWNSSDGQANIARRQKTYIGVISPDGVVYSPITNLSRFAKEHGLDIRDLRHLVHGRQKIYHGWVALVESDLRGETNPFERVANQTYQNVSRSMKQAWERRVRNHGTFVSPSGEIFRNVVSMRELAKQFGLDESGFSMIKRGKWSSYHGWTYLK